MGGACRPAWQVTGEQRWTQQATLAAVWFTGTNDANMRLYDPSSGACVDGLGADAIIARQPAQHVGLASGATNPEVRHAL